MRPILTALVAFFLAMPASAAEPDDFLAHYRAFLAGYNFTSRPAGVQALDDFLKANYTPDASIKISHNTTLTMPDGPPKKITAHGDTNPAGWMLTLGPQYEGMPVLFPAEGVVQSADIIVTRQSGDLLETRERLSARYRIIPGTNWFTAASEATCQYRFSGAKVTSQHCNADIRVSVGSQP